MIGKLTGTIDTIGEDFIILDVQGVGYLVHCSTRTLARLGSAGELAKLTIETHVREDAIRLYGFATDAERAWFRLLQTVQGVGAKVALAVLGAMSAEALAAAIVRQDKAQIAQAPGIGPRLAARLVTELKDKMPEGLPLVQPRPGNASPETDDDAPAMRDVRDAIAGLLTLGYARAQAADAVAGARQSLGEAADTAALIRQALKHLSR
ncbi:MAG: Holliday junction branch migration protein RuvA [Beijerinckiaceae bacterium]|nr:MAG: Holliday junction branch migration protein RuvA [Beijerinckiaceae bacterium]